jgi:hypothetical protein
MTQHQQQHYSPHSIPYQQHQFSRPPPNSNGYNYAYPTTAEVNPPNDHRGPPGNFRQPSIVNGGYAADNHNFSRPPYQVPRTSTPLSRGSDTSDHLPPIKILEPTLAPLGSPAPLSAGRGPAPPLPSPSHDGSQNRVPSYNQYPVTGPASSESARSAKRSYGSVFGSAQFDQPLRNGMRPSSSHMGQEVTTVDDDSECDDSYNLETLKMSYKRADGTEILRRLPSAV